MHKFLLLVAGLIISGFTAFTQTIEYPYPVKYFDLNVEKQQVKMAYMDVMPPNWNKQSILLLHGKNFNGFYWKDVIPYFTKEGYRVIIPDQVGWGKSSRPDVHYSFHLLANNTKLLLDSLGISKINVIGHSMGGMLATRFALMFPEKVQKFILENPIGLEDYKTFVPYRTIEEQYKTELAATYDFYKKYQQTYYPAWKDDYEVYVKAQAEDLNRHDFFSVAWVNAVTYQMIYGQPVVYEFSLLKLPALFLIGQADRTIVGKNLLTENIRNSHGDYPALGRKLKQAVKGSKLIELGNVGHIPHIQVRDQFVSRVIYFLKEK